ncbi:unnamed protein product [Lactuca saligna]|uniref:Uncharacterized protein n=1 Tax=Lactuca saligna TaxID=75948 RepID=A0AA35VD21_LACSI|nr:unnamed protein product [Lactuca saligna]
MDQQRIFSPFNGISNIGSRTKRIGVILEEHNFSCGFFCKGSCKSYLFAILLNQYDLRSKPSDNYNQRNPGYLAPESLGSIINEKGVKPLNERGSGGSAPGSGVQGAAAPGGVQGAEPLAGIELIFQIIDHCKSRSLQFVSHRPKEKTDQLDTDHHLPPPSSVESLQQSPMPLFPSFVFAGRRPNKSIRGYRSSSLCHPLPLSHRETPPPPTMHEGVDFSGGSSLQSGLWGLRRVATAGEGASGGVSQQKAEGKGIWRWQQWGTGKTSPVILVL